MHRRHYLGLLAAALAWGFNFAMVKIGLGHWPPLHFVGIRFVAVALALSPFLRRPLVITLGTKGDVSV